MQPGDVVLGDTAFCSFAHFALLLARGAHGIFRMPKKFHVDFTPGRPGKTNERRRKKNQPTSRWIRSLYRVYLRTQYLLGGLHPKVETLLTTRATAGVVRDDDRARYRECFRAPARGWNLLGDNTRFYAIGVLAWLHRTDLFFVFILVPMNLALVALWLWQRRAYRRFLDTV